VDRVAVAVVRNDAGHELEELRGLHQRVRDARRPHEVFLHLLRTKVRAGLQARRAHDRQRDMMRDARAFARVEQALRGRAEEVGDGRFVERRRVGDVDDDVRPAHRLIEALARDGVDPGASRRGDDVVSLFTQPRDEPRAHQPTAACNDDLHFRAPCA